MVKRSTSAVLSVLLVAAAAFPHLATADPARHPAEQRGRKGDDHERARQAVLRGEVLPLARILALTQRLQKGEVIEVELESRKGRLLYEVEVLTRSGLVRELVLDARTGALLAAKDD